MIGIEHHSNFAATVSKRIVDVSGFRILLRRAGHVMHAELTAGFLEERIVVFVTKIILMGITDRLHREQRAKDHSARLAGIECRENVHLP